MKNCIAIRRENKYDTERRAPLTPAHVKKLVENYGTRVLVEPGSQRVFTEQEYRNAGAEITSDLSDANIVFGVKEIPLEDLLPGQAYCFFSHTIKAQPYNMPMLKKILDQKNTLLDYELVKNREDQRQIFFGSFAGYAGMINSLWTLGKRLAWEGINTPFDDLKPAYKYNCLEEATNAIEQVGKGIREEGLPNFTAPLICGFCGYGQVSKGAQKIFDLLPHVKLCPEELPTFFEKGRYSNKTLYKVEFTEADMFAPKSGAFDLQEYFDHPDRYTENFHRYLPYLTMIVNGIFWTQAYPRLITRANLKQLFESDPQPLLRVIGDITCDIDGSIEMTVKATKSDNPVYVFNPDTGKTTDGVAGKGPVIMAVDILPAELPREASEFFGNALLFYLPNLANVDFNCSLERLAIAADFKKAVIVLKGCLTPDYQFLNEKV